MNDANSDSDLDEKSTSNSYKSDSRDTFHPTRLKQNGTDASEENVFSFKRKWEDESDRQDDFLKKSNLGNSYCVSPWEFRRLKADLLESQAQRVKLEDRIDQLHKKNKEAVIFFDKEKNEMKILLDSNRNTIKDLEYRLNKIRKRETECKEELNEKTKIYESTKQKLNEKIFKLETDNAELISKIEKIESDFKENECTLSSQVRELKEKNDKLKLVVEEKSTLVCSLEDRITKTAEKCKKYEEIQNQLQVAQLRVKELEREKKEFEESKGMTEALCEKVLKIPVLEKELNEKKSQVANLRQFLHNNVMLEEMVHDLKMKLSAFEERDKEVPVLKAKIIHLEKELEKWMALASDCCVTSSRDSLRDYIESLQRKELTTSLEINNLSTVFRSSEKSLNSFKCEVESLKNQNEKLETAIQKLKVEVQVLRKKALLVSRERDSYRQQLDLYENDLTMTGLSSESLSNEVLSQMKVRVKNLELSLNDYRKHVERLEEHLKEYRVEESIDHIDTICKLKEEVRNLEESNEMLRKSKDELEKKLETTALRESHLSSDVKVLHLRNNPVAEAETKQDMSIKSLMDENDKLRVRLKLLESGDVFNITQKVSEDLKNTNSQRVTELEKELQSVNLKMQRLKEVFKKTSQEFRDVSYMLLGYRIDLASNNKLYKLYNMYSSSPLDYLMFQQTKSGGMEMMGTEFAESLSKLVDEYLHKGNSIPAFLSAVTLELYGASAQSDDEDDEDDERNSEHFQESESSEPVVLD